MTTYKKLSGECLCGNVSWSMKGPFDFFGLCQCSLCRKLTGSGFASNLFVKFDQFQWISGKQNIFDFDMPKMKDLLATPERAEIMKKNGMSNEMFQFSPIA